MTQISRRKFIKNLALGTAAAYGASMVPFRWNYLLNPAMADTSPIHVIIALRGGCNMLSMAVPVNYDGGAALQAFRPSYYDPSTLLPLNGSSNLALNPALSIFQTMFNAGELAIVQQVGFGDRGVRAHDVSTRQFETGAENSKLIPTTGWVNRLIVANNLTPMVTFNDTGNTDEINSGNGQSVTAQGLSNFGYSSSAKEQNGFVLDSLYANVARLPTVNPAIAAMQGSYASLSASVAAIAAARTATKFTVAYANDGLSTQLKETEVMIRNFPTRIAFVEIGGFDTHSSEGAFDFGKQNPGSMTKILTTLNTALTTFRANMIAQGLWSRITFHLFTEFNRTIRMNGNLGFDHADAQTMFIGGPGVNGGKIIGDVPTLAEINSPSNALPTHTLVNDVYADIINQMGFGGSLSAVLPGHTITSPGIFS